MYRNWIKNRQAQLYSYFYIQGTFTTHDSKGRVMFHLTYYYYRHVVGQKLYDLDVEPRDGILQTHVLFFFFQKFQPHLWADKAVLNLLVFPVRRPSYTRNSRFLVRRQHKDIFVVVMLLIAHLLQDWRANGFYCDIFSYWHILDNAKNICITPSDWMIRDMSQVCLSVNSFFFCLFLHVSVCKI